MEANKDEQVFLGVDLNKDFAMVSVYQLHMAEPETVSTIAGSDNYQIPFVLAKRKGAGQWYYGDEAKRMAKSCEMCLVDGLLRRALDREVICIDEENFQAEELLALFLKKLIQLPKLLTIGNGKVKLVLTMERLNREYLELFSDLAPKLGFAKEDFVVLDHKEVFYYYAYNQAETLYNHDVYLFSYENGSMSYYAMERDKRTRPQVITISESNSFTLSMNKDQDFTRILTKTFENRLISSVYLVGDGFEGDWMVESLRYLVKGRRAFLGQNLFSKGACYGAYVLGEKPNWPFLYMGEHEVKFNLSLKVSNGGKTEFYNLISAGSNYFEAFGQCQVILDDKNEIDFWKQLPNSKEAKIETLTLSDLPKRPERTTRLLITARPTADDKIGIEIKDMGFGEFFRSSDKTWNYTMSM